MTPTLTIRPFRTPARGVARVPGSKSLTNRALIFAALADGATRFTGALFSRDTRILIAALRELGFAVEADEAARDCCDNTCKTDQGLREAWKSSIGWSLIKRCHCRALGIGDARS